MTNSKKTNSLQFLADELKKIGFNKKANRWMVSTNNITKLVELQSSSYWDGYYINLGVCFDELKKETVNNIASHDCHLVKRINPTPLEESFFSDENSVGKIVENIDTFFTKTSSVDWLKEHFPEDIKENGIEVMNIKVADLKHYIENGYSLK